MVIQSLRESYTIKCLSQVSNLALCSTGNSYPSDAASPLDRRIHPLSSLVDTAEAGGSFSVPWCHAFMFWPFMGTLSPFQSVYNPVVSAYAYADLVH